MLNRPPRPRCSPRHLDAPRRRVAWGSILMPDVRARPLTAPPPASPPPYPRRHASPTSPARAPASRGHPHPPPRSLRRSPRHVAARPPTARTTPARWASVSRTGQAASHAASRAGEQVEPVAGSGVAPFGASSAPEFAPGSEETPLFPAETEKSSVPVAPIRVCKPPTRRLVAFRTWACECGIAVGQRAVARGADKSFKFSCPRDSSGWVIYRDAAGLAVWLGLARSAACGWPVCVAGDRTIRKEAAYGVADAG
jgi:hypothetical protein